MKFTHPIESRNQQSAYTLLTVVVFSSISFLLLGSVLNWCVSNTQLNERSNQYTQTSSAAEAATEKVLAHLERDFRNNGEGLVYSRLGQYSTMHPLALEHNEWAKYVFSDGQGQDNHIYVQRLSAEANIPLQSQYQGLYGLASNYRVVSNARMANSRYSITSGIKQDLQLAAIPVFQFAIFYSMDLEINPGPAMDVTGRVHGNANIFLQPVNALTFWSHVTAASQIFHNKHTNDPTYRSTSGKITYKQEHDANAGSLTLPIGTNNTPDAVHAIVEVPPDTESPTSTMGKQRYYNKSDMLILVSNNTVMVKSGAANSFSTVIPPSEHTNFVSTNVLFYNKRESKWIQTTQIDVAKLRSWSQTNTSLRTVISRDVNSVYVADMRTTSSSYQSGVRLINGETLPAGGLTVATPNPLYVQGNYNSPSSTRGTTNTANTLPASLVGDSINVLSTTWKDSNSSKCLSSRIAQDTTVNAAFLSGIVPTGGGYYSGGVENFPRFLEDWSNKKLAYNGSMVVMLYSKHATAPWGGSDVYSPPKRQWTFDLNFLDAAKLPPGTPMIRTLIRGQWAAIKPGSIN